MESIINNQYNENKHFYNLYGQIESRKNYNFAKQKNMTDEQLLEYLNVNNPLISKIGFYMFNGNKDFRDNYKFIVCYDKTIRQIFKKLKLDITDLKYWKEIFNSKYESLQESNIIYEYLFILYFGIERYKNFTNYMIKNSRYKDSIKSVNQRFYDKMRDVY